MKNPSAYTGKEGLAGAVDQLQVWQRTARRQAEAMSRAAAAAEALCIIWSRLDDETRERLSADSQIRERIRTVTGYYGFNCA